VDVELPKQPALVPPEDAARIDAVTSDRTLAWHYTSGVGLLSILAGHTLWATSSTFLNDKREIALGGQLMATRIRELAVADEAGFYAGLAERLVASASRGVGPGPAHFFILSASSSWDSLAMWRLYGGAQESYALAGQHPRRWPCSRPGRRSRTGCPGST